MLVQGLTFLSPLGNQVFITVSINPKPDYFAHGFGWMNDGSLAVNISPVPHGTSVSYNKGFAFGPKGAVYATPTQSSDDVYLEGIRVSAMGALVLEANLADTYHSGNALILDGCLASSVPATTGPTQLTILTTSPLPPVTNSVPYSLQLQATGGTPPYIWNIYSDVGWITCTQAGLLTGDPPEYITNVPDMFYINVVLYVYDSTNAFTSLGAQLHVIQNVTILESTPPVDGFVGEWWQAWFSAAGGTEPYTWSYSNFPDWLTDSGGGMIGGMPDIEGGYTITVTVTDANNQSFSKDYYFNISIPIR